MKRPGESPAFFFFLPMDTKNGYFLFDIANHMKKSLFLLSMVGGLVLPAVCHADVPTTKAKTARKAPARHAAAVQAAPARQHVIYYITTTARTGSNIPMTYRKYDGRIDSASNAAVYGQSDLQRTGALDVGTELYQLDTAISFRR